LDSFGVERVDDHTLCVVGEIDMHTRRSRRLSREALVLIERSRATRRSGRRRLDRAS
jgi:hypothetical protein